MKLSMLMLPLLVIPLAGCAQDLSRGTRETTLEPDGVEVAEIRIPMPDGVQLFGCLWRPASAVSEERLPVLFKFDPYAASCQTREPFESYARAGYAVVYAHVRGTGLSAGILPDREYSQQELDDAVHVIDWLSRQEWSTGDVGMFGASWSGFNAIQVAMRNPPALKAIVPAVATENIYHEDAHFADGIFVLSDWTIAADVALIDSPEPANPFGEAAIRDRFDRPPWSLLYLRHQRDGDFWWQRQRLDVEPGLLKVPTMMIGGWYDGYRSAVLRAMQNIRAPFKAIVGPWDHGMTFPAPEAKLTEASIRWWDYWLKGIENGVLVEPAMHVYMRRAHTPGPRTSAIPGEWRSVPAWPPEGYRERELYFTSDRRLREVTNENGTHHLRYIPTGGVQAGIWWGDPVPDQRPADTFSLIYESEPLKQELQLLGRPLVILRVRTSAPLANWMVRLSDVAPDGTVTLITGAGKNGAHRRSSAQPQPLTPGETVSLDISLHFTSWIFEPGHQIRVAVSNALWPMFWPTPHPMNTELDVGPGQSRVSLPTIPGVSREAARKAAAAIGSKNLTFGEARAFPAAENPGWIGPARIERDEVAGITTVSYAFGTKSRIVVEYQGSDTDPAQARYLGTFRSKWLWHGEEAVLYGETEVISDATKFHYRHLRRLLRDGTVVREKVWKDEVPRDYQ